ncbi:hypothetical protein RSAG8_06754, partial [Rhizoctonia solani AG-8 WAC10335]
MARLMKPIRSYFHMENQMASEQSYGMNNGSFDETNSIISLYGKLYAPSQISEAESVISGSMPPSTILAHLSKHGCEDITSKLDPRSISKGMVSTGCSGDVYRGALQDGRGVGIKCLRVLVGMDEEGEKQVKRAARELYIWSKCKHPNIQELTGMALHDHRVAMISPWMKNGNLSWYISRHPEVDRYNLILQAAAAVAYLRQNGVVHGDIKAQNFLVSEDCVVKLTDFGSSIINHCSLKFTATTSSSNMTLRWTAPEIFLGETQREPRERPHATQVRDELEVINKQHQLARDVDTPTSSDTQTLEERHFPVLIEDTRNRRFWKRSWGVSGQTTNQIAESATRSVPELKASPAEKVDERKQRKLESLEKRKLQEERARARAKGVLAKRDLMLVNGNFDPGDWTDPLKVSPQGRATMRMPVYPVQQQPLSPSGVPELYPAIGGQWRGPYSWDDDTNGDQSIMSPDRRRLSMLTATTVDSNSGPLRLQHGASLEIDRGSSVSLNVISSSGQPHARDLHWPHSSSL